MRNLLSRFKRANHLTINIDPDRTMLSATPASDAHRKTAVSKRKIGKLMQYPLAKASRLIGAGIMAGAVKRKERK
jgi:hypothetical protein